MSRLKLEPPPPVQTLVEIAVDAEDTSSSSLSKAEIAQARAESYAPALTIALSELYPQKITTRLISRRAMLAEYFSFDISEDGHVLSLPLLLKDYIPNLDNLPNFLMRLGPQASLRRRPLSNPLTHICPGKLE
jgi:DNA mismatch repair protein MLH1